MNIKIHQSYRTVVAICDSELIGKTFVEGKKQLDLRENFYRGEKKDEKQMIPLMIDLQKEDCTFNIVGEKSVNAAIKAGIVGKEGISKIQGIPYALGLL